MGTLQRNFSAAVLTAPLLLLYLNLADPGKDRHYEQRDITVLNTWAGL